VAAASGHVEAIVETVFREVGNKLVDALNQEIFPVFIQISLMAFFLSHAQGRDHEVVVKLN